jgi:hypothetical protein
VAGSGRRGGVLVEGGSDGVTAASKAVLMLEVKAREELRALRQSGTKSTAWGEKNPAGGGRQHPFKGGGGGTQQRGSGKSSDAWRQNGGERGGALNF